MDRLLATLFLVLLLVVSGAVQHLVMDRSSVRPVLALAAAGAGTARGAGGMAGDHRTTTSSPAHDVRVEVSLPASAARNGLPDGGVVYNSRGLWLTDTPGGKPERVDRGPVPRQSALVPILMYHHVRPIDFKTSNHFVSELTLPPSEFEQQLRYLQSRGIATVSMEDLYLYLQGREDLPQRSVILTFDDGYADNYLYALPLLRRYGDRGTFFIATGLTGRSDYMSWADLKELVAAGMEIGGHTIGHVDLAVTPAPLRDRELVESKRALEDHLGVSVTALSYPGGAFNAGAEAAARKAGYVIAVTTRYGAAHDRTKIMELSRVRVSGTDTLPSFRWKIEQYFPVKGPEAK